MKTAIRAILAALCVLATMQGAETQADPMETGADPVKDLSVDDTLGDLRAHSALDGFAARTLPWLGLDYDPSV